MKKAQTDQTMQLTDQRTYYQASARPWSARPAPVSDLDVDTLVVGGGYAGLATALSMLERGAQSLAVIDAQAIGYGASGRNGGFVFAGYSLGEGALLEALGPSAARAFYQCTVDAVDLVRVRIQRERIECDLVDEGVLWTNWFNDAAVLRSRQQLLRDAFGVDWPLIERDRLRTLLASERYSAALFERNAFHLHPLDYARGMALAIEARGGRVFEQTRAGDLKRQADAWQLRTAQGTTIRAQRVILCCGGYLAGLRPEIDRAILPIATYVMATEPLGSRLDACFPGTRAAVYDSRFAFDYYRPLADTRLLWGGRISILDRSPASVAELLKRDMLKVFPQLAGSQVEFAWSGLMSYARHEMPQIGQLAPNLWYAQAFGGHGLATTTAAGELLASAICEGDTRYLGLSQFGLQWVGKPLGYLAAQARYSYLQWLDARKDRRERLA